MNVAIIYYSRHHGNTKKLLDGIKYKFDVDLFDVCQNDNIDISKYDIIGLASGIYYSKFNERIIEFAKNNITENKNVFLIYTCGMKSKRYTKEIEKTVLEKSGKILGIYSALGFDTFGPFKLIGGLAKGHPSEKEIQKAADFYKEIIYKET